MWLRKKINPADNAEVFLFLAQTTNTRMRKVTEEPSLYRHLEQMPVKEMLTHINEEDAKVHHAVQGVIPRLTELVEAILERMKKGGRIFYIGAGTSGRLGILDASECPPTYGVPADWVIGLIAGGDHAIRNAVEFAEDSEIQAWKDLKEYFVNDQDTVIGIAASGTTPYVVHGLKECQTHGILTSCITCNPDAPVSRYADYPLEVIVGPEFVTGSTRMKAGTAQKLVLNMISTTVMIGLGRVVDNKMVDMQLSNQKLVDRGTKIIKNATGGTYEEAKALLLEHGSVRKAIEAARQ
jgi:N-acetylmuramic acid 6-phosphate etherase